VKLITYLSLDFGLVPALTLGVVFAADMEARPACPLVRETRSSLDVARVSAGRRDPDDWAVISAEERQRLDALEAQLAAEHPRVVGRERSSVVTRRAASPSPGRAIGPAREVRRVAVAASVLLTLAALGLGYAAVTSHPRVAVTAQAPVTAVTVAPPAAPPTGGPSLPADRPPMARSLHETHPTVVLGGMTGVGPALDRPPAATSDVRAGFQAWVESMRGRHLSRHLVWYADPVHVFYDRPNVPRRVVETIRSETFRDAVQADVEVSGLDVRLDRTGTAATIVFRKRFVFEGPRIDRRGTVTQELQWERTSAGWRIVGERDLNQASLE
jgi:hypothetical protein